MNWSKEEKKQLTEAVRQAKIEVRKYGFLTPLHLRDEITKHLSIKIRETFGLSEGDEKFNDYFEEALQLYLKVKVPKAKVSLVADR